MAHWAVIFLIWPVLVTYLHATTVVSVFVAPLLAPWVKYSARIISFARSLHVELTWNNADLSKKKANFTVRNVLNATLRRHALNVKQQSWENARTR